MNTYTVEQSKFAHFFTVSTASAPLWLIVRLYLGYDFLMAGWGKFTNPAWFGNDAGAALQGFIHGAVAKTVCAPGVVAAACHPDVQMWYASFLQSAVLPYVTIWSNAVVLGEIAIGLGLIVGLFTGVAAFFAFFMSLNFLFAGTVSVNPIIITLALPLIAARRVAGYWGLDRFARPFCKKFCSRTRKP
ncbi:MAG: DoxX family protein [bacterium]|nr:DoxX family protein [bacterium]